MPLIPCACRRARVGWGPRPSINYLTVYEPVNGWTTVTWPMFFGSHHAEMAQHLSSQLHVVVCSADVYHSETWQHVVYDDGGSADEYATYLSYLVEPGRALGRCPKVEGKPRSGRPAGAGPLTTGTLSTCGKALASSTRSGKIPPAATIVLPEQWDKLLRPAP